MSFLSLCSKSSNYFRTTLGIQLPENKIGPNCVQFNIIVIYREKLLPVIKR